MSGREDELRLAVNPQRARALEELRRIDETRSTAMRAHAPVTDAEESKRLPLEPLARELEARLVEAGVWDPAKGDVAYANASYAPVTLGEYARLWGIDERYLRRVIDRLYKTVRLDVADRICTYGIGDPGLLRELYPEEFNVELPPWTREPIELVRESLRGLDEAQLREVARRVLGDRRNLKSYLAGKRSVEWETARAIRGAARAVRRAD